LKGCGKKSKSKDLDFFICAAGTTSFAAVRFANHAHTTSFERQLNIIAAPCGTNERCCTVGANDVLRNDVGYSQ
jgi:hypothetical protein